ncbi:hypothetical protein UFOVP296_13 [uncultured Caudovirales phage]|uniref:Uncharacterized protein n=1 Tax=uncultured Caudovirales phage TaxID=2100421 RepID=A0A6J5LSR8_9CAUD|nr:hypothetical protein UFOVP296_13 [uncultured Caudovirales phage]CAB4170051.1 hypothetical protein UFOVP912_32 [uncultured Caudovirales phage]CAB4199178.1 hypothetical protein UFOVP1334_20 [uncultured Caudovirales phage]
MTDYAAPDQENEFDAPEKPKNSPVSNQLAVIIAILVGMSDKTAAECVDEAKEILKEAAAAVAKSKPKAPRAKVAVAPAPEEITSAVGKRVAVKGWTPRQVRGGAPGEILDTTGVVSGFCRRLGVWELVVKRDGANLPTSGVPIDRVTFI